MAEWLRRQTRNLLGLPAQVRILLLSLFAVYENSLGEAKSGHNMGIWVIAAVLAGVYADTLVALVEVCRHGARAPIQWYPWDTGSWPEGYGELSPAGMRQHYLNGVEFRNRYITENPLVAGTYNAEELFVRSTDVNRTIMSAQSQLMGWFPAGPVLTQSQVAGAVPPMTLSAPVVQIQQTMGLDAILDDYQPVPIHMVLYEEDTLLLAYDPTVCPGVHEINAYYQQTPEYLNQTQYYAETWQTEVEAVFGGSISLEEAAWMGDTLWSEWFHGFPKPAGVSEELFDYLVQMMSYFNANLFRNSTGMKLSTMNLFSAIDNYFNMMLLEPSNPLKFYFYSCHDTNIAAYLTAMGAFDCLTQPNPPFASTLMFELWADGNSPYVIVKYNDVELVLPGCGGQQCSLEDFNLFTASLQLPDFEQTCSGQGLQLDDFKPNPFLYKRT